MRNTERMTCIERSLLRYVRYWCDCQTNSPSGQVPCVTLSLCTEQLNNQTARMGGVTPEMLTVPHLVKKLRIFMESTGRINKSLPLETVLIHLNLVHTPISYLFNTLFRIILRSTSSFLKWSLSICSPIKCLFTFLTSSTRDTYIGHLIAMTFGHHV